MISIEEQAARGALICPDTRQSLELNGDALVTPDGSRRYPISDGVPMLVADPETLSGYLEEQGGAMAEEYAGAGRVGEIVRRLDDWVLKRNGWPAGARYALARAVYGQPPDALVVSVGGGPRRWAPNVVNLNIERFENVDVVGDAYALPYADSSVDSVMCWAVLEHLEFPDRAVAEIYRVLKPSGVALFGTPFLQAFHAYPNHFQNFTKVGHDRLLERAGFEIEASGAIGPTFALLDLISVYLRSYLPGRVLKAVLSRAVRILYAILTPVDRRLGDRPDSYIVASNVFVLGVKAKPASTDA
jgi:SAM-dependent methyltransferase